MIKKEMVHNVFLINLWTKSLLIVMLTSKVMLLNNKIAYKVDMIIAMHVVIMNLESTSWKIEINVMKIVIIQKWMDLMQLMLI